MAKKNEERSEDLNPRSEDVDEKIRRLLDPSEPDPEPSPVESTKDDATEKETKEPAPLLKDEDDISAEAKTADTKISSVSGKKPIASETESEPDKNSKDDVPEDAEGTAPELEPKKLDKKVIKPIEHTENDSSEDTKPDEPSKKPAEEVEEKKEVVKITISHDGDESKEDLAEKLDEAIAELGQKPDKNESVAQAEESAEVDNAVDAEDTAKKLDDVSEDDNKTPAEEGVATDETLETVDGSDGTEPTGKEDVDGEPVVVKKVAPKQKQDMAEGEEDDLPAADLDSAETEEAVKDIVSKEGDELLVRPTAKPRLDDDKKDTDAKTTTPHKSKKRFSLKKIFNKTSLKITLALLFVGAIAAMAIPKTRYQILNTAGVRSSSNLMVIDISSQQPLKNVTVTLGGITVQTDTNGLAEFNDLRLGETQLKIERTAFATIEQDLTIGWGSNPLGSFMVEPTGAQYKIHISDFLSESDIAGGEVDSEFASAKSDEKGLIILTLPPLEQSTVELTLSASQYRTEVVQLDLSSTEVTEYSMVPAKRHVFVSKRSGNYDIYSVYADGADEQLLLKATGTERDDLDLITHPDKNKVAYVSTRSGKQSSTGFLLSDLIIIDIETGETEFVATSEKIQLVGWWDERIVYVTTASGASAAKPDRSKLTSYSISNREEKVIAQANYFNDLVMIKDTVYYAPSGVYSEKSGKFYKVLISNESTEIPLFDGEVWSILRIGYDELALSVGQDWYSYILGGATVTVRPSAPVNTTDRQYVTNYRSNQAAWVDQRDGKGVLLSYLVTTESEKEIVSAAGIKQPVAWLNDSTVVYRVETRDETADYVVNIHGGKAQKITDVTGVSNINNWYYY